MDGAGNIFIADRGNGRIRKVPQVEPSRRWQAPVRRASPANLFISEACRVRQGSASGIITTVAGGGTLFGASADGGPPQAPNWRRVIAESVSSYEEIA